MKPIYAFFSLAVFALLLLAAPHAKAQAIEPAGIYGHTGTWDGQPRTVVLNLTLDGSNWLSRFIVAHHTGANQQTLPSSITALDIQARTLSLYVRGEAWEGVFTEQAGGPLQLLLSGPQGSLLFTRSE